MLGPLTPGLTFQCLKGEIPRDRGDETIGKREEKGEKEERRKEERGAQSREREGDMATWKHKQVNREGAPAAVFGGGNRNTYSEVLM